jgi:hypothetical protein
MATVRAEAGDRPVRKPSRRERLRTVPVAGSKETTA